ncbi:TPA: hypothetical protein ACH3X1_009681 [Trebouxia sp. C0004]
MGVHLTATLRLSSARIDWGLSTDSLLFSCQAQLQSTGRQALGTFMGSSDDLPCLLQPPRVAQAVWAMPNPSVKSHSMPSRDPSWDSSVSQAFSHASQVPTQRTAVGQGESGGMS